MKLLAGAAISAAALLALPGGASASTIECSGKVVTPADGNGRAFGYTFSCGSPEGDNTQIDAYSILSNKDISSFSPEVVVSSGGVALNDQSFGCEGPFPGEGFGCFGKASLYNQIDGGFQTLHDPCSPKSRRKGAWHIWVVAAGNKINPVTDAKTMTTTEPQRLRVPGCEAAASGDKGKGKGGKRA